jgi:hypothetical protein
MCVTAAQQLQPEGTDELQSALEGSDGEFTPKLLAALLKYDTWLVSGAFGVVQVVEGAAAASLV